MRAIVAARIASVSVPVRRAAASSISAIRAVLMRPGAMPLIRTGAISSISDLMSPASPGRIRFDAVRPGTGSRAVDDRMTRIAGRSLVRRCGSAALTTRTAERSVPSMARSQAA
jgi:hypothetical protein